jgi:hypothetical protein
LGETPRTLKVAPDAPPAKPQLDYLGDRKWRLTNRYVYHDAAGDIVIPKGFVSDLASVPRFAWWLISPMDLSEVAPLVHDFVCRTPKMRERYTSRAAHQVFFSIMLKENVPLWRALLSYLAVLLRGPKWKKG